MKPQNWVSVLSRVVFVLAIAAMLSPETANAQGCIVARSSLQGTGPQNQGGYLAPGDWELTLGYRHQFSYKHFVGPTEQTYRVQQGTQVMNKVNLEALQVTYQVSPRFSLGMTLPVL